MYLKAIINHRIQKLIDRRLNIMFYVYIKYLILYNNSYNVTYLSIYDVIKKIYMETKSKLNIMGDLFFF